MSYFSVSRLGLWAIVGALGTGPWVVSDSHLSLSLSSQPDGQDLPLMSYSTANYADPSSLSPIGLEASRIDAQQHQWLYHPIDPLQILTSVQLAQRRVEVWMHSIRAATPVSLNKTETLRQSGSTETVRRLPTVGSLGDQGELEIRVAIAQRAPTLTIGADKDVEILDLNGTIIGRIQGRSALEVRLDSRGLWVGAQHATAPVWLLARDDSPVFLDGYWYRGRILIVPQEAGLLAVNYLPLEAYLASVVGSEVPVSWPTETLKAQAIAARSYAIVHLLRPASIWYDLTDTERHQVYSGMNTESPTTQQAIADTMGIFVSYRGGIVETMYAANDRVIAQHHRGVQSMSQTGARDLGQMGYRFDQILAYYYPGTELAVFENLTSGE